MPPRKAAPSHRKPNAPQTETRRRQPSCDRDQRFGFLDRGHRGSSETLGRACSCSSGNNGPDLGMEGVSSGVRR